MLSSARYRARKHSLPFNLKVSDIYIPERCPVLGMPLRIGDGHNQENSPSLDRIIPELGYVRGNVIVVSLRANVVKSDATPEEIVQVGRFYESLLSPSKSPSLDLCAAVGAV
jgi:hypothetical protein